MDPKKQDTATTTASTAKTTTTCADIWSASKCKEKKKASECGTTVYIFKFDGRML